MSGTFPMLKIFPRKNEWTSSVATLDFQRMSSEKNVVPLVLVGLLFICAITSAASAIVYLQSSAELRGIQIQAATLDQKRNLTRALANDVLEYSKRNPEIDPLLRSVGLKPALTSPKASK
jgi:hypothetical protein